MAKITSLAEITEVASDDLLVVVDKSDTSMADSGTDKKVQKVNLLKGLVPENGWIPAGETWTYVSTDDPTGVIKINANVTSKYSEGMRFKMTNGGNTIYAIITKMGTYGGNEAGYTYITFLHEIDPTDSLALHLMANSAITNPYYSTQKAPQGFPLNPAKWSVQVVDTTTREQTNAVDGAFYNLGGISISCPTGCWYASGKYTSRGIFGTGEGTPQIWTGLSASTTGFTNSALYFWGATGSVGNLSANVYISSYIEVTSKTTYYVLHRQLLGGSNNLARFENSQNPMILRFTCAYL